MLLLMLAPPAFAQEPIAGPPATRAEAIASQRADKVACPWPERQSPLVDKINGLLERGFGEGLDSGRGVNGPQLVVGGMRAGQGFTAGLGYRRSDLLREHLGVRTTARGTLQRAHMFDVDLDFKSSDQTHVLQLVFEIRASRTSISMDREHVPKGPTPVSGTTT